MLLWVLGFRAIWVKQAAMFFLVWLFSFNTFASIHAATSDGRLTLRLIKEPPRSNCEYDLTSEFNRRPDDSKSGLISDRVPLTVPNMLAAYQRGIFPWGADSQGVAEWFSPPNRAILDLTKIDIDHPATPISRSDRKFIRKHLNSGEYTVTFDQAFERVINECAKQLRWTLEPSSGLKVLAAEWLTQQFIDRYTELHKAGHAHSVEVWRNGKLVAGLYGVFVNGFYSGESMFHDPVEGSNATKLALYALAQRLRGNGHHFIDTQMAIGLAGKWGASYITRDEYLRALAQAQSRRLIY